MQANRSIQKNTDNNHVYFSGPGMYYKGDWRSGEAYAPQNCVTIRSGSEAGLYLCIGYIKSSLNSPATSIGDGNLWLKIAALESHPIAE